MMNLTSILEKAKDVTASGLPIMKGREGGELQSILDDVVLIDGYEFGTDKEGNAYTAFTIKENDTEFFFGGSVVTENLKTLDNILTEEEKNVLLENGLPVTLIEKKSEKNNRRYIDCKFCPENE